MRCCFTLYFILLLPIDSSLVFGQSNYQNGYVVTNQKDTIFGQLRDRSPEPFGKIFKKVRLKRFWIFDRKLGPEDLNSYTIGKNVYESIWYDSYTELFSVFHVSTPNRGKRVFMRLAVNGDIKLYWDEYRDPGSGYELEIPFFKKVNSDEMIRVTQGVLGFKKKHLANLFADCPDLVKQIEDGLFVIPEEIAEYYNENCQ